MSEEKITINLAPVYERIIKAIGHASLELGLPQETAVQLTTLVLRELKSGEKE